MPIWKNLATAEYVDTELLSQRNVFSSLRNGLVPRPAIYAASDSYVLSGRGTWVQLAQTALGDTVLGSFIANQDTPDTYVDADIGTLPVVNKIDTQIAITSITADGTYVEVHSTDAHELTAGDTVTLSDVYDASTGNLHTVYNGAKTVYDTAHDKVFRFAETNTSAVDPLNKGQYLDGVDDTFQMEFQAASPSNGDVLTWDSSLGNNGEWKANASSGGSSTLISLTDTNISSPIDGDMLIYDNTASEWRNKPFSGDITIDKTGVTAIVGSAVTNGKLASTAITGSKFDTAANGGLVTSTDTILTYKLSDTTVPTPAAVHSHVLDQIGLSKKWFMNITVDSVRLNAGGYQAVGAGDAIADVGPSRTTSVDPEAVMAGGIFTVPFDCTLDSIRGYLGTTSSGASALHFYFQKASGINSDQSGSPALTLTDIAIMGQAGTLTQNTSYYKIASTLNESLSEHDVIILLVQLGTGTSKFCNGTFTLKFSE